MINIVKYSVLPRCPEHPHGFPSPQPPLLWMPYFVPCKPLDPSINLATKGSTPGATGDLQSSD